MKEGGIKGDCGGAVTQHYEQESFVSVKERKRERESTFVHMTWPLEPFIKQ